LPDRVLITGAGRGIGKALATELATRGYEVIATARRPDAVSDVPASQRHELDVMSDESACRAIAAAGRIDILINNAGIGLGGPTEAVPLAEAKRLFDTNFFGPARMMHAVLPQMRARRSGTIVNISSLAARVPWPFGGYYAASKAALESLSEALDIETAELGLRVIVVEPGVIGTDLIGHDFLLYGADLGDYAELGTEWAAHFIGDHPAPDLVARAVADALTSPVTPLRLEVGQDAVRVLHMRRTLSDETLEEELRRYYRMRARAGRRRAPEPDH
jgi:NAD(P)-dependent dehydrogenase (short-subunit alcohol dehydrogenase family)